MEGLIAKLGQRKLAISAGAVLCYLGIIRLLRYRRRDRLLKQYGYRTRSSFSAMTLEEAGAIQREIASLEFPRTFLASIGFALLKTYGIPSISRLLVATAQLSDDELVSKRAIDTGTIMHEVIYNEPSSPRSIEAIARMNFLHEKYRKSGKMSDEDMMYTLGMFALEPMRWVRKFEWRDLTDLEKCAIGLFWKDFGDEMGIPHDMLKPYMKPQYNDGLAWLEALEAWSIAYEQNYMLPSDDNAKLGQAILGFALLFYPKAAKPFAGKVINVLMEPRLLRALKLEDPDSIHIAVFNSVAFMRRTTIKYLLPPRPTWLRVRQFTDKVDPKTGRYHRLQYIGHPWYIKPTIAERWGPAAWLSRLLGKPIPGDEGTKYLPEGYILEELGPDVLKGRGGEFMAQVRQTIRDHRQGTIRYSLDTVGNA